MTTPGTDPPAPPFNKNSNMLREIDSKIANVDAYLRLKINDPSYRPGQKQYEQLSAYEQQRLLQLSRDSRG
ncbi:MAG: hypothetical protein K2Y22_15270 [Candidatus Obscuribacterales bacterium]|nr:hypothetical protein [Candidatus Obscuribacterales bacterium]